MNLTEHTFSSSIDGSTDSVKNNNEFKDIKGFGGLVDALDDMGTPEDASDDLLQAVEGAVIELYKSSDHGTILDTATTDEHGWYFMENFQHKGKLTDYTVKLVGDDEDADGFAYSEVVMETTVGRNDKFGEAYFVVENTFDLT